MTDTTNQPRLWTIRPERVVTVSTGIVHVSRNGIPMCGARTAVRTATTGTTPTCRNCGAR